MFVRKDIQCLTIKQSPSLLFKFVGPWQKGANQKQQQTKIKRFNRKQDFSSKKVIVTDNQMKNEVF